MARPHTAMTPVGDPSPNLMLDGEVPNPAWQSSVGTALRRLLSTLRPDDLAILAPLAAQRAVVMEHLSSKSVRISVPEGAHEQLPVTVTLLAWDAAEPPPGPAVTCLVAVLVNAALGVEGRDPPQRRRIVELAQMLRGAIGNPDARLLAVIATVRGVPGLLEHLDTELTNSRGLHVTFERIWEGWLRGRLVRWVQAEPRRLHRAMLSKLPLHVDIRSPSLPAWGDSSAEADDLQTVDSTEVGGDAFDGLYPRGIHALATAWRLSRRSGDSGLALEPDHFVPDPLICHVVHAAMAQVSAAFDAGAPQQAEPMLALAFAVATGLRESDLGDVVWGGSDAGTGPVLSVEQPCMRVALLPPAHAACPGNLAYCLKEGADTIHWPIPPLLHRALSRLAPGERPQPGSLVFAARGTVGATRLRTVLASLLHGAQFGAGQFRLAMAANIAGRFGPEMAQWVMRDSFCTSLGPAYYCAVPERDITSLLAALLARWFGEDVPDMGSKDHFIGSKVVPRDDVAAQWSGMLRKASYSAARRKDARREVLAAERNHLACALAAATGHRPGAGLGALCLDSVIPEYGLVVLEDKQVDVLRRTRVAVTGHRWIAALRVYLDRLIDLLSDDDSALAKWAMDVLCSRSPLLSLPAHGGEPIRLDMQTVRETMPAPLRGLGNHYRHRLNQRLMHKGVDWELRHAQMGWVVSPAYALAELSPISPFELAERLSDVIDEVLVEDGWFSSRQRIPRWTWEGVPDRPLSDWKARLREYEHEHEIHTAAVRAQFHEHRSEAEKEVLPCLKQALAKYLPELSVNEAQRTLEFASSRKAGGRVKLTMDHYALLRDAACGVHADQSAALRRVVAEYLVHEFVTNAIKAGVADGPEPHRRHMGLTAKLSPFLPGIGLAVRHANVIREQLRVVSDRGAANDQAAIALLSVLANTPYRDFEAASKAVRAASAAVRGRHTRQWLRVPAKADQRETPMVFGGVSSIVLGRRGQQAPTARPLSEVQLGRWLQRNLKESLHLPAEPDLACERVVAVLQVAGRMELSGPERLVMEGCPLASVPTERALAWSDEWPLRTRDFQVEHASRVLETRDHSVVATVGAAGNNLAAYRRLTAALNPNHSSAKGRLASDGHRGWRQKIDRKLVLLLRDVGEQSPLGLIVAYVIHRLRYGGKRRKLLTQGNLHKEVTRFGRALLDLSGTRYLPGLDATQLQTLYLAVLQRKGENVRRDVLEELKKFHHYLETVHHAAQVDFEPLSSYAGSRVRQADAGVLTRAETHRVLQELLRDVREEQACPDANPSAVRCCSLRVLMFLMLHASGIRPQSAYGLVLGDLYLLETDGDYVHVHRTGVYGEAKTTTSVGFIRCEGNLWAENRQWVLDWVDKEKTTIGNGWWKQPVFGDDVGSRTRFARTYLTHRIDVLLRWASGERGARTYWLRKRRVTSRMKRAMDRSSPRARDMYQALRESGHAAVVTPLMHYVHDAALPVRTYLRVAGRPDRAAVMSSSALPAVQLDQKWHSNRRRGIDDYYGVVLDRLGVPVADPPVERVTEPPAMFRQAPLVPRHLDTYFRQLRLHGDRREAMMRSGLSDVQVASLEAGVRQMWMRVGRAPWRIDDAKQPKGVISPARRLTGTQAAFALMDQPPDDTLQTLVSVWIQQGHLHRIHDTDVIMALDGDAQCAAAAAFLERTQLNLQWRKESHDRGLLCIPAHPSQMKSHGDVMRWVLAMCWLSNVNYFDRSATIKMTGR